MTVYTDDFTGTDGNPPASPWVTANPTTGTTTIQTNALRFVAPGTIWERTAVLYGTGTYTDVDITVQFQAGANSESYAFINWRHDGAWAAANYAEPSNCYSLQVAPWGGTVIMHRWVAGVATTIATSPRAFSFGTAYWARIKMVGALIRAKVWAVGATEPGWDPLLIVEDATFTAAGQVSLAWTTPDVGQPWDWDNFSLNDAPVDAPLELVQRIGTNNSVTSGSGLSIAGWAGTTKPQIGDLIVLCGARNDIASDPLTGDSISADPGSNTYTRLVVGALATAGTANDGAVAVLFYSVLTAAWPGGNNTLTWGHPTTTARAMQLYHYAKGTGYTLALVASSTATATSTTNVASVATGGTLAAGDLVVTSGAVEHATAETGDADTTNGDWTPVSNIITTGTTTAAMQSVEQHKWVTATGAQTWNPTGTSTDTALIIAAFRGTLVPTKAPPPRRGFPLAILAR